MIVGNTTTKFLQTCFEKKMVLKKQIVIKIKIVMLSVNGLYTVL